MSPRWTLGAIGVVLAVLVVAAGCGGKNPRLSTDTGLGLDLPGGGDPGQDAPAPGDDRSPDEATDGDLPADPLDGTGPDLPPTACARDADCTAAWGVPPACHVFRCGAEGRCTDDLAADGSACDDGDPCATSDACDQGVCRGQPLDCDDRDPCTQDTCTAGTCEHVAFAGPCDDGDPCTVDDACVQGGCRPGPAAPCDDHDDCTTDGCVAGSGCVNLPSTGNPCDDGNACTTGDACDQGTCRAGGALDCDLHDPCSFDTCSPATGCVHTPTSVPCDDGDACTQDDRCDGGTCRSGAPRGCDDGDACTLDSCDAALGCLHAALPDATLCDDGNPCTLGDACSAGACVGVGQRCDDDNPCTDDRCEPGVGCLHDPNSAPCDLGSPCTTADRCVDGACAGGTPVPCDDGNPCTDDACDPALGCTHVPHARACDDLDPCTTGETCADGRCSGGGPVSCDDGLACTTDHCKPAVGCVHEVAPGFCRVPGAGCVPEGTANPSNPCEACRRSASPDGWSAVQDGTECEAAACDGMVHHARRTCVAGQCSDGGQVTACDDANVCTLDTCLLDGCRHLSAPDGARCGSGACAGLAWTRPGECTAGACRSPGTQDCDDGQPCTIDSCDASAGCSTALMAAWCLIDGTCRADGTAGGTCLECRAAISTTAWTFIGGKPCDDGNPCTRGDTCAAGGSGDAACRGTAYSCDDGLACTQDACDGAGGCTHAVAPGACLIAGSCVASGQAAPDNPCQVCAPSENDRAWSAAANGSACGLGTCNGLVFSSPRTCDRGQCVGGGTTRNCDDGLACTTDSCSPSEGCVGTLQPGQCVIAGACRPEGTPNPDNPCEACLPASGTTSWSHRADGTICGSAGCAGLTFTSARTCQDGRCAGGGTSASCDDANSCTEDSCDPATGCRHGNVASGTPCGAGSCSGLVWTRPGACADGACLPVGIQNCDDGLSCTGDACDPVAGCAHWTQAGSCLIAGACYAAGTPAGKCLECRPGTSLGAWTYVEGKSCDDGNACTRGDTCAAGGSGDSDCRGTAYSCNDGLACTADACDGKGGCANPIQAGFCVIGGACHAENQANPANPCQLCLPARSTTAWSSAADGATCGPGTCSGTGFTSAKTCSGGQCVGGGTTQSCDDGFACTLDTCAPASGCAHALQAGQCFIDDGCFAEGQPNPLNACQICRSTTEPLAWSAGVDGTVCAATACAGLVHTAQKTCTSGQCTGGGQVEDCNDGLSCTSDACTIPGCLHALNPGSCLIDGACLADGQANPGQPCQVCRVSQNTSAWSAVTDGTACGTGMICLQGVCSYPTCTDGLRNGTETDADCGGSTCPPCALGKDCTAGSDCTPGTCVAGTCAVASCTDGVRDGLETDLDCGGGCASWGGCAGCGTGGTCASASDCANGVCTGSACVAARCFDGVRNGLETDVDCGGADCRGTNRCLVGMACSVGADCRDGACQGGRCRPATCIDGAKNGGETALDCGGPDCQPCAAGGACAAGRDCASGVCSGSKCAAPTCFDGARNGNETDADCGGAECRGALPCGEGKACLVPADCQGGLACTAGTCRLSTCADNRRDGLETDVDCGGDCNPCEPGRACQAGTDCVPGRCSGGACALPTCNDGVRNGLETGTDCGGPNCPRCARPCTTGDACITGACVGGRCLPAHCGNAAKDADETGTDCGGADCPSCQCANGVRDLDEGDIDCGGRNCGSCANLKACLASTDCRSMLCQSGVCRANTCVNGARDAKETDVDCGGADCMACALGKACAAGADCVTAVCQDALCRDATCGDGRKDGTETAVDCGGGACGRCANLKTCLAHTDCSSGFCQSGVCRKPTCGNSAKDGAETDVDCGGADCATCATGKACSSAYDCATGVCQNAVCRVATCGNGAKDGAETDVDCGGAQCGKCADLKACAAGTDCSSGLCQSLACRPATCNNAAKDGSETDVDCGGSYCLKCATGKVCAANSDCSSGSCSTTTLKCL